MARIRKNKEVRKEEILAAALLQAQLLGIGSLTRSLLAAKVGTAESNISHHFGTMQQLTRAVLRHAVKQRCIAVVRQGIALDKLDVKDLPPDLVESLRFDGV